ncbi:MAG: metallophosphoesterase [Stenotrophobium sp.]
MRIKSTLLLFAAIAAALALWAFWIEPDSLRVRGYDLPLLHWPVAQDGLRIALLTDLHAGAPYIDDAKIARVVTLTNQAHPDLILLLGDYVRGDMIGGRFMPPEHIAALLVGLQAPLGVYAVLGNNDNERCRQCVLAAFRQHGIVTLEDRLQRIDRGRFHFWLAGFSDLSTRGNHVAQVLAAINDTTPVIAMTHDPALFPKVPARVSLLLAGHTHGGQVRLPLIGAPAIRFLDLPYTAGHYRQQTDLFVSSGIGTSNLAVRFGVPPEISVLTVHQQQ